MFVTLVAQQEGDNKNQDINNSSTTMATNAHAEAEPKGSLLKDEEPLTEAEKFVLDGHAQVGDPIEPPARHAPKDQTVVASPGSEPMIHILPSNHQSILSRLYDPDRQQKPQIWQHIKLVAPGPADQPPPGLVKWRSKDAVAAYCLKCKKQFTYTKGTSKTVSRHMEAFHGLVLKKESGKKAKSRRSSSAANVPPLKKRKPEALDEESASLLKWIVSSYLPFDVVDSPGFDAFVECLSDSSFGAPTAEEIAQIGAREQEKVKLELRRMLGVCNQFSLVCYAFTAKGKQCISVSITFCIPAFQVKRACLGIFEGTMCQERLLQLLDDYSLSLENATSVRMMGTDSPVAPQQEECLLYQLGKLVHDACGSSNNELSSVAPPDYIARAFMASKGNQNEPVMTAILQPFYDAHIALAGDSFPSPGLAITVIRRVRDALSKMEIDTMSQQSEISSSNLKAFHRELLGTLDSKLPTFFGEKHPAMHSIPLDPRLILMVGLSDKEKEEVNTMLVEKVIEKRMAVGRAAIQEATAGDETAKKEESSLMGGVFWGSNSTGDQERSLLESATAYATSNVQLYFTTVKLLGAVQDPLAWWNSNQKDFPELAELARAWLGTSKFNLWDKREAYTGDHVELTTFLSESLDFIGL